MDEHDDLQTVFLVRQTEAEDAMLHGDVAPRLALWSRRDPVSLLGAWGPNKTGWAELERTFGWVDVGNPHRPRLRLTVRQDLVEALESDGIRHAPVGADLGDLDRHGDLAPVDESPTTNCEMR